MQGWAGCPNRSCGTFAKATVEASVKAEAAAAAFLRTGRSDCRNEEIVGNYLDQTGNLRARYDAL